MKLPQFPVEGGCQCGAVRYRLKARPLVVYVCHCKNCQRFSGTTHMLSMFVKADDVELLASSGIRFVGCDFLSPNERVRTTFHFRPLAVSSSLNRDGFSRRLFPPAVTRSRCVSPNEDFAIDILRTWRQVRAY
jgi:hypothetical protein